MGGGNLSTSPRTAGQKHGRGTTGQSAAGSLLQSGDPAAAAAATAAAPLLHVVTVTGFRHSQLSPGAVRDSLDALLSAAATSSDVRAAGAAAAPAASLLAAVVADGYAGAQGACAPAALLAALLPQADAAGRLEHAAAAKQGVAAAVVALLQAGLLDLGSREFKSAGGGRVAGCSGSPSVLW